jgi:hypothetical protein
VDPHLAPSNNASQGSITSFTTAVQKVLGRLSNRKCQFLRKQPNKTLVRFLTPLRATEMAVTMKEDLEF